MQASPDSISAPPDARALRALLPDFAVIAASGADALAFLHGQLTQDVANLPPGTARLAGYCTAKGRLLATLVVWRATAHDTGVDGPQLFALVRRDLAEALVKRLSLFVLRAKAKLAVTDLQVAGVHYPNGCQALPEVTGGALPEAPWQCAHLSSGTWIVAPSAEPGQRWWWITRPDTGAALAPTLQPGNAQAWGAADLAAGLPWVAAATQDLFIPQTLNLDLLGGISFTKGCYPGQEVVARSHYRGTVKRRTAYGRLDSGNAAPGVDIYDTTQPHEPCGRVVDAADDALLFETTLASLLDGDLRLGAVDGPRIAVVPLPYALAPGDAGTR